MAVPLLAAARRRGPGVPIRSVYRETAIDGPAAAVVVCAWEGLSGWSRDLRLLPDAAVDLVWNGEALLVEPALATAVRRPLPAGRRPSGLRLAPAAAGAVLGVAMEELNGQPLRLRDLWGAPAREAEDRLAVGGPVERRRILQALVADRLRHGAAPDVRVAAAVHALGRPGLPVEEVAGQVGLSPRELRRRFQAAVGLSPKAVQRIARFHRVLALLRDPRLDLAQAALDAGYADQAHMTHEVRRLAGATPAALR